MRLGKGLDPRPYDIHLDKRKRVWESNKGILETLNNVNLNIPKD